MNPKSPPLKCQGADRHEFLANVGHELRNPLTTIIAQVEILMEGVHGSLESAQQSALSSVQESARQMLHLLADTIDLFKMEADEPALNPDACVMSDVCAQSLPPALDLARSRSVEVQTDIKPGLRVKADARRLRQIITETLSAAVLTFPTGSQVLLTISGESQGLCLEAIRRPIPASCAAHVIIGDGAGASTPWLERLRKVKPVGTALLHRAVCLLNGTITMSEEAGQIAGITIHLPVEILPPLSPPAGSTGHPISSSQEAHAHAAGTPTILIADDQQALITVVSSYLESLGFKIIVARDGREAVDLTAAHRPDLILMDVRMPVMDGLAAIREIRSSEDSQLGNATIISLSGIVDSGDKQECLDAGATDYLNKPFGIRELDRVINEYLRPTA
ncbi:MAG: response regulator [Prosthecobacter sp.]|uniref:response regulator n=1 Tax=Prosthecobacter sp. TaxID=1965333 RepID=UPI0019F975E7|nr:hybrid sensor histidine kinase/response regulator [Prosthecobacter sp.]MBE2286307.1 response regulator [Prosthecobacter sp.]